MKRRFLLVFVLALLLSAVSQIHVHAYTRNSLTRSQVSPREGTILTDVATRSERHRFFVYENDDRNLISPVGNARIGRWESDIHYVLRAPELLVHINRVMPGGTEFQVRLHNLEWFFRNNHEDSPPDFNCGIERLLPTSYNRLRGTFVPSGVGTGGTYTRIPVADSYEAPFRLVISNVDPTLATIVLTRNVIVGEYLRIPIVARVLNPGLGASVEVVGTQSRTITSTIHTALNANWTLSEEISNNRTTTRVPIPMTGVTQIRVPDIVITENVHATIGNGSFQLTAPEGFIIVPEGWEGTLDSINRRTPYMTDAEGNPIIDVTLGGGLRWRNNILAGAPSYQQNAVSGTDFRLRYRNPAGNIDASILTVELTNIVPSTFRNSGSITISGLMLVAVGDPTPGNQYMTISRFTQMENFTDQRFLVGTIVSGTLVALGRGSN